MNIKKVVSVLLLMAFAVVTLSACSSNSGKKSEAPVSSQVSSEAPKNQLESVPVMDEFHKLAQGKPTVAELILFIDKHIAQVQKEEASLMTTTLEEVHKRNWRKLEKRYLNPEIQQKLRQEFPAGFNPQNLEKIQDGDVKKLLAETVSTGYKVESIEGAYFPIIDYGFYKKYAAYLTPDLVGYIEIMAVESDNVSVKDAGLVVSWEEIFKRTLRQEKYILTYPKSPRVDEVKRLFNTYLHFALFGFDNTPLFSYGSKNMNPEAKSSYLHQVAKTDDSKFNKTIREYFAIIQKNNYQKTAEVEQYRKKALQALQK